MSTYLYIRVDCILASKSEINSFVRGLKYEVENDRIVLEEVKPQISLRYRDMFFKLINNMKRGDLLIVKGVDCLGSNFNEINYSASLINKKGVRLICYEFSEFELKGVVKDNFLKVLKVFSNFEINMKKAKVEFNVSKKVGRPEILNQEQKKEVINLYKKGESIYAIAKKYSVARTVIKRVV
ncbi:helix-turn-helix domain-containing protein, partial [Acinetobacter bereziniae]|uniref:helix-turn-helix domain-containing protein n=1 Tax=Acinetobacter bereziniae TaxID=106648 RepID=UPI0012501044